MVGKTNLSDIRLTEFGAARQVPGSKIGLGIGKDSHLIDCGISYSESDLGQLPFKAEGIDSLILTHAHADHMGQIPDLYKSGFRGPIYSTATTAEICSQQIGQTLSFDGFDSSRGSKPVGNGKNRNGRNGSDLGTQPKYAPRYEGITLDDIMDLFRRDRVKLSVGYPYNRKIGINDNLSITFYEAGHIPGAAQVLNEIEVGGRKRKLLTMVDLGRTDYKTSTFPFTDTPFVKFPHTDFEQDIDYMVAEATYGARTHRPMDESISLLESCLAEAYQSRSKLIIPAFSIMRTQMVLYYLFRLDEQGKVPNMPIYFSSPSAAEINRIMLRHCGDFDEQAVDAFKDTQYNPFDFDKLEYITDAASNRELVYKKGPLAVIASSGMCDFGRVVGHLENSIDNPKNIILLTGYNNPNTRGWQIEQKANNPSLEPMIDFPNGGRKLLANVHRLHGMSGHADGHEMTAHITNIMPPSNPPRQIFIKHGESEQCDGLKSLLIGAGYKPDTITVMEKGQTYNLD